jgi:hypothetical protein
MSSSSDRRMAIEQIAFWSVIGAPVVIGYLTGYKFTGLAITLGLVALFIAAVNRW